MNEVGWLNTVALPVPFGLFGFTEPCSIGATLLIVEQIEGRSARDKIAQALVVAMARELDIGLLGLWSIWFGLLASIRALGQGRALTHARARARAMIVGRPSLFAAGHRTPRAGDLSA